jgi:hypothetical protein
MQCLHLQFHVHCNFTTAYASVFAVSCALQRYHCVREHICSFMCTATLPLRTRAHLQFHVHCNFTTAYASTFADSCALQLHHCVRERICSFMCTATLPLRTQALRVYTHLHLRLPLGTQQNGDCVVNSKMNTCRIFVS